MIYTVTFNPAIDYVMRLPTVATGETNRAAETSLQFGGKGINVSLVLRELGAETTALGFVAGFTGEALAAHLTARGIPADFIALPYGLTRINVKVKADGTETELNAPGPEIPADCLNALLSRLDRLKEGDALVLAGSIPPSLPRDIYARIAERLAGRGVRLAVDAEGEVLTAVLPFSPFLIKPNRAELEGIVGHPLTSDAELSAAAAELQRRGALNVLVSLGGDGALLLDERGVCHRAPAHRIRPVNTVGAGDSMLAGFLVGAKQSYDRALSLGMACGAATAAAEGLATREAIEALLI